MKMDLNNFNHQMVIAALIGMVEDDGLSPREAFMVLDDIKKNTFHTLMDIRKEGGNADD